MPIPLHQLTGETVTFVRPVGNVRVIRDDFVNDENPARCLRGPKGCLGQSSQKPHDRPGVMKAWSH